MRSIPVIGPMLSLLKVFAISVTISGLIVLLLYIFFRKRVIRFRTFLLTVILTFIGWQIWTNSYWADTGYYDSFRIPIGYKNEINGVFGEGIGIIKHEAFQVEFRKLYLAKEQIFGITETSNDTTYLIYNISQNDLVKFTTYKAYLSNAGIPKEKMITPEEAYYNYWGKLLWLYE